MALPESPGAVDVIWIEINALFDPFQRSFQRGMSEMIDLAGQSASDFAARFVEQMTQFLGEEIDAIGPEFAQIMQNVADRMRVEEIGFEQALRDEFTRAEEAGKGFTISLVEVDNAIGELRSALVDEIAVALDDTIDKVSEFTNVDNDLFESLKRQVTELRLSSKNSEEFQRKLGLLVAQQKKLAMATTETIEPAENVRIGFARTAEEMDRLVAIFATFSESAESDVKRALALVLSQLTNTKDLTIDYVNQLRASIEQLRASARGSDEFKKSLSNLTKEETKLTKAGEKKTAEMKKQGEETEKTSRRSTALGRGLKGLATRFATMFLGVQALRKIWNSFNRTIRESVDLYLETTDELDPINMVLGNLESQATQAKLAIGATAAPFRVLGEAIKAAGLQVLAIILPKVIDGLILAGRTAIILVGSWLALSKAIREFAIEVVAQVLISTLKGLVDFLGGLIEKMRPLAELIGGPIEEQFNKAADAIGGFADKVNAADDAIDVDFGGGLREGLTDVALAVEEYDRLFSGLLDLAGEVPSEAELIADRLAKAFEKIEENAREAADKAQQQLNRRLADIEKRTARRRADARRDLGRDLVDIDRDAARDALEAQRDFQLDEFRLTEEHKLALLELEENFIFNLEDAVMERDARGVLRLQRQFNLEKKQLERDKNLRTKRLKEDFKRELVEIERQRQIRRAERIIDFNEQLEDIQLQEDRLRADAEETFRERLQDINDQTVRELQALTNKFIAESSLTAEGLRNVRDQYEATYGPNGFLDQVLNFWEGRLAGSTAATGGTTALAGGGGGTVFAMQRGGTVFATSPSMLMVGEGGPERVDVTPLSRSTGAPRAGFDGGAQGDEAGRVEIEVNMGEGLRGEIADEAMDMMSNVLVRVTERGRRER